MAYPADYDVLRPLRDGRDINTPEKINTLYTAIENTETAVGLGNRVFMGTTHASLSALVDDKTALVFFQCETPKQAKGQINSFTVFVPELIPLLDKSLASAGNQTLGRFVAPTGFSKPIVWADIQLTHHEPEENDIRQDDWINADGEGNAKGHIFISLRQGTDGPWAYDYTFPTGSKGKQAQDAGELPVGTPRLQFFSARQWNAGSVLVNFIALCGKPTQLQL